MAVGINIMNRVKIIMRINITIQINIMVKVKIIIRINITIEINIMIKIKIELTMTNRNKILKENIDFCIIS